MTDQYQSAGDDLHGSAPEQGSSNPTGRFGGSSGMPVVQGQAGNGRPVDTAGRGPPSVIGEEVNGGGSNISAGVVRRKKRVVKALSSPNYGRTVEKNYRTSGTVLFNNAQEIFQDMISREYAQEIVEEFFDACHVDTTDPQAAQYAEDVLWLFLIATTASNKADYNKQFDVPTKNGAIALDFSLFSNILQAGHGVTRRNFARGVADDLRRYLSQPENTHLLPVLATRIGCDQQFAHLAFDGSTHCTGMTTREVSFTKTLESRNLFEDEALLSSGASERLMQGLPSGPRSVVPR